MSTELVEETLEQGIVEEKARLSTTLNGMYESLQFMREELQALEKYEAELQEMIDFYIFSMLKLSSYITSF